MNYPIPYVAIVNLLNFTVYISIPIVVRYLILRKPLKSKWLAIGILVVIFIGFSSVTYRIASAEIMRYYLNNLNESFMAAYKTGLTDAEQEHYRNKFSADATEYGLWEAVPAADIQRQKIKRKIDEDYNISYEGRPRIFGSPILLCVAMVFSYFILLKGQKSISTAKNNESTIQRITPSKVTEVSNFEPVCPHCRTEIAIDSAYCHKCGNKIAGTCEEKQG